MRNKLSDKELVEGMVNNNNDIIAYFFFEKCTSMFHSINHTVYQRKAEVKELINELYLYLRADDWRKLRQFDYRVQLMTWVCTVAKHFFLNKQAAMMEYESIEELSYEPRAEHDEDQMYHRLEVENLILGLQNQRYRFVLQKLFLEEVETQQLAEEMGIIVDNLYNIKSRALKNMKQIAGNEQNVS